jgi:hypothetical protein
MRIVEQFARIDAARFAVSAGSTLSTGVVLSVRSRV